MLLRCWRRWKGCGAVDCKSVKLFGRKREGGGCGRWGAIVSSLNGNALNRRRTPQWVGGTLQAPSVIQPESWIKGRRSESWRAGFKLSTSSPLFLITMGNGFFNFFKNVRRNNGAISWATCSLVQPLLCSGGQILPACAAWQGINQTSDFSNGGQTNLIIDYFSKTDCQ